VSGIVPLLQPVAHSLLQCRNEVRVALAPLSPADVWARPAGAASAGYHARHALGSLDRLFTYARGERLTSTQLASLASEGREDLSENIQATLVAEFDAGVNRALAQLEATDESSLLDARGVGRAQLPSTVLGLLFHAAEHTQRHVGQLVTTAKIVQGQSG
jgi:uncharacterized damage-inducible protein DinB